METNQYLEWIREGLRQPGKSQNGLAAHLGVTHAAVSRLVHGHRRLMADEIAKIGEYLGMTAPTMMVPIVGLAGAGPEGAVWFTADQQELGRVPAPPNADDHTVALEVRGHSMRGIAEDGWLVFYGDPIEPDHEMFGEPCVCFLEDGRTLVKFLFPARNAGLFDLESTAAPTMRDIPLRAAALITSIVPRRSAQKHIKRNPDLDIDDIGRDGWSMNGEKNAHSR